MCCKGKSRYGSTFSLAAIAPDQRVVDVLRIEIHQANPGQAVDRLQPRQQLRQPRSAVEVKAIEARVLGDEDQFLRAVGDQFLRLLGDLLDRLAGVRPANAGDRAKAAQAVASLGDLQKREVPRRDAQPAGVLQRPHRRRLEEDAAIIRRQGCTTAVYEEASGGNADLVAGEDAHQLIDVGMPRQQVLAVSLGQAAGDDDPAEAALPLQLQHFADDGVGFVAGVADESAGVDDDEIRPLRFGHHAIAIQPQQAGHPLAVHEVLGAAQANQGIRAFHLLCSGRVHRVGLTVRRDGAEASSRPNPS